jgi:DMSO/TMAO reductase YedYZ molybdopterin-dependent catalytic subunit
MNQYDVQMTQTPGERGSAKVAQVAVGRRTILGFVALGALGVAFGSKVQQQAGNVLGGGFANFLPGGDRFRYYSITGKSPVIKDDDYRLTVTDLVERPLTLTLADLKAMLATDLTNTFQCVTGWSVPGVHWRGVQLSHILDLAGVKPEAVALQFESYDGLDTESLFLEQARLPNVLVAYEMFDAPITVSRGGPVRLYVAPMFGYKSLKWLSGIRVRNEVFPGFWEQNGYPLNGWLDGSTVRKSPSPDLQRLLQIRPNQHGFLCPSDAYWRLSELAPFDQ